MAKVKLETPKDEAAGTPEDEAQETPELQKAEVKAGAEDHGEVKIPENFQKQVTALIYGITDEHQIDFINACLNKKRTELMDSGEEEETSTPAEFSEEGMPD